MHMAPWYSLSKKHMGKYSQIPPILTKSISRGNHEPWTSSPFLQDRNLPRNKDWDGKCIWLRSWRRSCGWLSFRARCRLEGGLGDEECSRSRSQPGFLSRCLVQTQGSQLWLFGEAEPALCSAAHSNAAQRGTWARAPSPAWTPVRKCAS